MDLFASMRMYVAVVDGGSFAAAADKLDISRAMVSKQIQKLEEHLGTRLMNRTTRRLSLTETGREFYERSAQIMGDVEEAEQIAGQMTRVPQGVLQGDDPAVVRAAPAGDRHRRLHAGLSAGTAGHFAERPQGRPDRRRLRPGDPHRRDAAVGPDCPQTRRRAQRRLRRAGVPGQARRAANASRPGPARMPRLHADRHRRRLAAGGPRRARRRRHLRADQGRQRRHHPAGGAGRRRHRVPARNSSSATTSRPAGWCGCCRSGNRPNSASTRSTRAASTCRQKCAPSSISWWPL